ncbi:DUF2189 domain-containing protein [Paracoccus sulfuroxidans]|uniref:Putative membrane protein n=1 Tax=Paracoccus sulfuroxidans TaxID=384678 RepID=A0A562NST0_9RHOB|nr:DUF2189 domain-containing protein [Paracoccus sulfuroxidans]TWI35229.1 putative membrane protein [Paracoccus sulfuroxidans]
MTRETIGNPISWSAQRLAGIGHGLSHAVDGMGTHDMTRPQVNTIDMTDIRAALRAGVEDFTALRSDILFLVILYPVIGFIMAVWAFNAGQLHLLFPLVAGFPLMGPVAALGLYEMSRQRERGKHATWASALHALRGRVLGPVLALAAMLAMVFAVWLIAAHVVWIYTMGPEPYQSLTTFLRDTLTTSAGWEMILIGCAVGFVFAALVLCMTIVSFPMLLDRPVGVPMAIATSLEVTRRNPGTVAAWGLIVAASLLLGSIPLFVGLIVVLPILGHATWHLYRRAVTWPDQRMRLHR